MKTSAFFLASLLLVVPCMADVIIVRHDGSGDYPTIQSAIDAAGDLDIIELQPGRYAGSGNRDINFRGKLITVRSTDPNNPDIVAATIVNSEGAPSALHRGFFINANAALMGLTITGGYQNRGGAIYCYYAAPIISHCNITGNTSFYDGYGDGGGGIYSFVSAPTINDCMFINNVALGDADGGAIRSSDTRPSPTITNCTFTGNRGDRGGALYNCDAPITNCIFTGNVAYCGGGLHSCDGAITNCTIISNAGAYTGGLDWCRGPISNCVISGNSATVYGGGGMGWCHTTITNCIIAGNYAAQWGAGIYDSHAVINNCVIFGNISDGSGGGICFRASDVQMKVENSIIWNNEAVVGNQIAIIGSASEIYLNYCDIKGGTLAVHDYAGLALHWGIGNIDVDPCFVTSGYWDPNDTPADHGDDFWVDGDYHLKSEGWRWQSDTKEWTRDNVTSRCIDAGNPGMPLDDEPRTLDVDPLLRFGKNIRIDMGAYGGTAEAGIPPHSWSLLADLTNNGMVTLEDYAAQTADWLKCENHQAGDLNRDGIVDISDVVVLAKDWLRQTSWAQLVQNE